MNVHVDLGGAPCTTAPRSICGPVPHRKSLLPASDPGRSLSLLPAASPKVMGSTTQVAAAGWMHCRPRWFGSHLVLLQCQAAERVVDASEIRFCQRSMKRRFQAGPWHLNVVRSCTRMVDPWRSASRTSALEPWKDLIRALASGRINPMTAEFLKLTVVEKSDELGKRALFSKAGKPSHKLPFWGMTRTIGGSTA